MPHSQREVQRVWNQVLDNVREHYDEIGQLLVSNKYDIRMECCEHGIEFTPAEMDDCLTIINAAYEIVTIERGEYFND